ncbi:hypothetical protein Trydic_g10304 [Trypoxylus dichotomus]
MGPGWLLRGKPKGWIGLDDCNSTDKVWTKTKAISGTAHRPKRRRSLTGDTIACEGRPESPEVVDDTGPYIPFDEVAEAIKSMKERKSSGPNNINTEFLKLLDDDSVTWITSVFNRIYTSGKIPQDWLTPVKKCGDYRRPGSRPQGFPSSLTVQEIPV